MAKSSDPARLGTAFFDRPTPRVARDLLGAEVRTRGRDGIRSVRLVEVEAYTSDDPASHAFRGPTRRNRSMYGPPGTLYVYRIHQVVCANLVTRRGQAVLLRAGEPLVPADANPSGPGRLCRVLGLTIEDDGVRVSKGGRLSVLAPDPPAPGRTIVAGPRIGISRAVERPLRFSLLDDPWVSRPRPVVT